jgi:hypothetical protein
MLLVWNGVPLADDKKKLNEYGVNDGDMVLVQPARRSQPGQGQGAGTNHPSSDHYIIFQIIIYVFPLDHCYQAEGEEIKAALGNLGEECHPLISAKFKFPEVLQQQGLPLVQELVQMQTIQLHFAIFFSIVHMILHF